MRVSLYFLYSQASLRFYRLIVIALLICFGFLAEQPAAAQAVAQFPGTTRVGQTSAPVTVTVTIIATGTAATPVAVTQGVTNLDFSITGGTCAAGVVTAGGTCTAELVFTPKYPGLRSGAVVIKSSDGTTLLGSALVSGVGVGSLAVLDPGVINTVAGNQFWTYSPGSEGYAANASALYLPYGVVVDPAGKMYISDTFNTRVRMVDTTGKIWTIAGDGTFGYSGDGGPAANAEVNQPAGLAIDGAGNLYLADSGNDVIRRIDAVTGVITTVAGTPGSAGFAGDGGAATAARLSAPEGIAFDAAGNLFIADTGNDVIRKVNATDGTISTVAGEAGEAAYTGEGAATDNMLNMPWSVAVGLDGAVYIADTGNSRIRRVIAGVISTVAGSNVQSYGGDGGPAIEAALNQPYGITLDPAGDLYIADSGNHCIRKVSPGTGVANGTAKIQTIIGTTAEGYAGDGKAANSAELNGPYAVVFAQNGDFYFADTHNDRIRLVSASPFSLGQFPDTKATKVSSPPETEALDSDGNADLNLGTPGLTNAALDASTTCSFTTATPMGTSCTVAVNFAPATVGSDLQGSVLLNSDAANTPAEIDLTGNGLDVNPTNVTVTSSASPTVTGQTVTLTATVTNHGAGSLTGPVTFQDGGTTLCSNVNVNAQGVAACPATFTNVGTHSITASYAGDANNEAMSGTLYETVKQTATVSLSASPTEATVGSSIDLSLAVTAPSGTPTGTVTVYYDSTAFDGPVTINDGTIVVATNAVPPGHHTVWATYSGDANDAPATSNEVAVAIDHAATTTTLASSNTNSTAGTAVTFTATVSGTNGFTPTGSVEFTDNGVVLGTATLNGSESASLTVTSLTPGNHAIVATYQGDTDDAPSYTVALNETVAQIATLTTLSSDANPLAAGATLHLTATVALAQGATPDGALTGQVTFTDGGTALSNPIAIDGSGRATLAVSSLAVGSHTIVATYGGATNYATSTASTLDEQVEQTATSVTLTSSAASALAGKPVTLSAAVTSSTGVPTGTVTFSNGPTVLGTVALTAQGGATLTISSLPVGSDSITATYNGDSNYTSNTSAPLTESVSLAQPVVMVSGPVNAVDIGSEVLLTGTLSGPGVAPTGTLTLMDGSTMLGSQTAPANGGFNFSTKVLGLGTHTLTVVYSGDSDNATATSAPVSVVIQQAPTATALSTSVNPGTVGQPITLTASVVSDSPGLSGTVIFLDGATTLGSAGLSASGTATLTLPALGFGVHAITANYGGDESHATSGSAVLGERMIEPATATLTSSVNPAIAGSDLVLTVTIAASGGQTPTGTVTFMNAGETLGAAALNSAGVAVLHTSSLNVGQDAISATYAGDTNVAAASASLTETIVSATTQVSVASSTQLATYGSSVNLTATVTSNGVPPTGQVTFTDNGTVIGSAAVSPQGTATLTISTLSAGGHTIVAAYPGDGHNAPANSTALNIVVKQTTSVSLASSANPALTASAITLTATLKANGGATASGTVTFSDGSTAIRTASLNQGVASITLPSLPAGDHPITAAYEGDGQDFASDSSPINQVVNLRASATTLSASHTDPSNPQAVTLIAVVQANGPSAASGTVSFSTSSLQIGTAPVDANGVATLTILLDQSTAAENIVAQYSGDEIYAQSSSAAVPVQAAAATQFTLSVDPATVSIATTEHTTVALTLQSIAGFNDTIQLGCLGLPFAATCTFSAPEAKLASGGSANVQLTIDTGDPLGMGAQTSARLRNPGRGALLCGLPAILLLGVLRHRRKLLYGFVSLACIALMISGCSGLHGASTPPGTYTFKVTASGQGSGATQSQVMTLTVTQ